MSPALADFAGGAAGTTGAGADVEPGAAAGAPFGPEPTEGSLQPPATMASAPARIQIARLFMIVPLSYGNQAQAFCQNQRNGERNRIYPTGYHPLWNHPPPALTRARPAIPSRPRPPGFSNMARTRKYCCPASA